MGATQRRPAHPEAGCAESIRWQENCGPVPGGWGRTAWKGPPRRAARRDRTPGQRQAARAEGERP